MSFQQGLSGLNGAAKNLDVIGHNIANTSTVGFKSSQAQFADVYATSLFGVGSLQVGIGTKVADVAQSFTQGNISATGNTLDLAITGEGFFRFPRTASPPTRAAASSTWITRAMWSTTRWRGYRVSPPPTVYWRRRRVPICR
jgi:flagellar hook-basal body protein